MIECKFFNYSEEKQPRVANSIVIQKVDSDFQQLILLNSKECQLLMDRSNEEASWALMCESIEHKSGIAIMDGNWELVGYSINGIARPLH
jgi:hypothetical protein